MKKRGTVGGAAFNVTLGRARSLLAALQRAAFG